MFGLGSLFGNGKKTKEMIDNGAKVIDVRTPGEFDKGHYKGSINIPLDQLPMQLDQVKDLGQPLVTVCRSGMRSGQAATFLKKHNIEAENGGPWTSL